MDPQVGSDDLEFRLKVPERRCGFGSSPTNFLISLVTAMLTLEKVYSYLIQVQVYTWVNFRCTLTPPANRFDIVMYNYDNA